MEQMSRTERAALCNSALEAGEGAPTLCTGWTVKDLVIHLLIRERDPIAATAIMVPQLEKLADRKADRMAKQDFSALVERVRNGPPRWSPMAKFSRPITDTSAPRFAAHWPSAASRCMKGSLRAQSPCAASNWRAAKRLPPTPY